MIGTVLSKKDLTGSDLDTKLDVLFQQKKFKKLVEKMQEKEKFNPKQLAVEKAYAFEAVVGEKDRSVMKFNATIINLVNEEKNINILYNEIPAYEDYYFGQIIEKGSPNNVYRYKFENKEILITHNETDLEKLEFTKEDIKVNDPDGISTQAWWTSDGCLPGGYQHCGGNCGYNLDHGGDDPINATDTCCVAHDRCYRVFGDNDNCCDKELVSCVEGHDTWAAVGIRAYFGPQGLLC
ncbi:hypothetical protein [Gracilibacillus thailandensis]|nr:hypothetical protein [Gracilibacillus thailandensis]